MTSVNEEATTNNHNENNKLHICNHPVLRHKLTILRSSATHSGTFRALVKEITYHLGYEATNTLALQNVQISVPPHHSEVTGKKLSDTVALIPILRSGLGMVDSMLELLPMAHVHHIGMYKSKQQTIPVQYYNRLPRNCESNVAYILDVLISSASSVNSVISILKKWGVPKIHVICIVASEQGLQQVQSQHGDVSITVGCVDELENGSLSPGLGDSGDRLFGTFNVDDDEALLHPSRRKRGRSASVDE